MQKLLPYHERVLRAEIERACAEQKASSGKASAPAISKTDIDALREHFAEILTGQVDVMD